MACWHGATIPTARIFRVTAHVEFTFVGNGGMGGPDQSVIDTELKNVDQFLAVLEIGLAGKDWIAGDLSVADFALASTFMYRVPSDIPLDDLPNVAAWIERLEARQSWKDAFAPVLALLGG